METWIWVVIIIFSILILVGGGIGLYFLLRKKSDTPTTGGDSGNKGKIISPSKGGSSTKQCHPSSGQDGTIKGSFSLSPAGAPHAALTIAPSTQTETATVYLSSNPDNIYGWTLAPFQSQSIYLKGALTFGGQMSDPYGFQCNEGVILASTADLDNVAAVNIPDPNDNPPDIYASWGYTPSDSPYKTYASTFCSTDDSGMCLYYNQRSNSVVAKQFNPNDLNFRWIIGPSKPFK